jgi:hypothetical protein
LARIYEEDVLEEIEFSPASGINPISSPSESASVLDNYNGVMEHRSQAYSNRNSLTAKDRIETNIGDGAEYQTLYRR